MTTIRPPSAGDFTAWSGLYAAYAEFYGSPQTPQQRDQVWTWILDPNHETSALVAEIDAELVGLAHYRPFARPLSASTGGYLDDLFVSPTARGAGVASTLLAELQAIARKRGWSVIRWITAEDNSRARRAYDRVATATRWVTYDLPPGAEDGQTEARGPGGG